MSWDHPIMVGMMQNVMGQGIVSGLGAAQPQMMGMMPNTMSIGMT